MVENNEMKRDTERTVGVTVCRFSTEQLELPIIKFF